MTRAILIAPFFAIALALALLWWGSDGPANCAVAMPTDACLIVLAR